MSSSSSSSPAPSSPADLNFKIEYGRVLPKKPPAPLNRAKTFDSLLLSSSSSASSPLSSSSSSSSSTTSSSTSSLPRHRHSHHAGLHLRNSEKSASLPAPTSKQAIFKSFENSDLSATREPEPAAPLPSEEGEEDLGGGRRGLSEKEEGEEPEEHVDEEDLEEEEQEELKGLDSPLSNQSEPSPQPTSPNNLEFHVDDEDMAIYMETEPAVFQAFKEMASPGLLTRLFKENPALLSELVKRLQPPTKSPSASPSPGRHRTRVFSAPSASSPSPSASPAASSRSPAAAATASSSSSSPGKAPQPDAQKPLHRQNSTPNPAAVKPRPLPKNRPTSVYVTPPAPAATSSTTTPSVTMATGGASTPVKPAPLRSNSLPKSPRGDARPQSLIVTTSSSASLTSPSKSPLPSPGRSVPLSPRGPVTAPINTSRNFSPAPPLVVPRNPRNKPTSPVEGVNPQAEFRTIHAKIQRNSMIDLSDADLPIPHPSTIPQHLPASGVSPAPPHSPATSPAAGSPQSSSVPFYEIIRILYQGNGVLEALSRIMQELAALTQAADVRLFLLEPKSKNLHLKVTLLGSNSTLQVSLDTGLVAEVVKTGEEIHTSDCAAHPAFDSNVDNKEVKGNLFNTDIYPLQESKWIIGALQMVNRKDLGVLPSASENSALAALLHLCALTLKQASLNEREKVARTGSQVFFQVSKVLQKRGEKADKKAQIFLEFSQRLNEELDSQQVVQKLLKEAKSYFDCDHCFLFTLNPTKTEWVSQQEGVDERGNAKIPVGKGIIGHVARTGDTILTNDARSHKLFDESHDRLLNANAKSILCAPVKHENNTLGVLQLVNKSDGEFTEVDQKDFEAFIVLCTMALHNAMLYEKESREKLKITTLLGITADLYRHLEVDRIMLKVMMSATNYLDAERFSLFMLDKEKNELFAKVLKLDEAESMKMSEIRVPLDNKSIAGHVFLTGEILLISNAYEDPRFNQQVDLRTGFKTKSILCVPIRASDEIIGVAQILNKREEADFDQTDVEELNSFLGLCSIALQNAMLYEREKKTLKKTEALLEIATNLCQELDVDSAMRTALLSAESFVRAERCSLFLKDEKKNELYSRLFSNTSGPEAPEEMRIPLAQGIAGYVVQTGEIVNISDAYSDPRFNADVDKKTGFVTKSILCMPLKFQHKIIGAAQLLNKEHGTRPFSAGDIEDFQSFLTLCGIALRNAELLDKITKRKRKLTLALDLLSYHSTADLDDAAELARRQVSIRSEEIERYDFDPYSFTEEGQIGSVLRMFMNMEVMETVGISFEKLCRFVLTVRKNYRSLPYHNFSHAICVSNQMYKFVRKGLLNDYLDPIETLALFIACLCHDIDHRGRSNAFQKQAKTALGDLYSTSTLERHHWKHTLMILSSEGHNIFSRLPSEKYQLILSVMEYSIMATDLSQHFASFENIKKCLTKSAFDRSNFEHRKLLYSLLMTSCDLASVTKPFEICKDHAIKCMSEFWEEAEEQRTNFGIEPNPIYLPEKRDELAKIQAGFLTGVCIPAYQALADFVPETKEILDNLLTNRNTWEDLATRGAKFEQLSVKTPTEAVPIRD